MAATGKGGISAEQGVILFHFVKAFVLDEEELKTGSDFHGDTA